MFFAAALAASAFAYTPSGTLNAHSGTENGVAVDRFTFADRRYGFDGVIVHGTGSGKHPGVLFVHWLGDEKTSNTSEFHDEQLVLAKRGVTSLAVNAPWSRGDWFDKVRTPATDYQDSIDEVARLRVALDILERVPGVDTNRIAYVGHDFGAMYGAVLAGVDPRPKWYVLMAGTTSFAQWFLLGVKPPDVAAYTAQMAPLDPPAYLARSTARAFLFQFSSHDHYITAEQETQFFAAAPLPKAMALYDVDHSMKTAAAEDDRTAWLLEKLRP